MISCSTALHRVRRECSNSDSKKHEKCMNESGVFSSKNECPCDNPTRCVTSGNSQTHWICATNESNPVDQRVYGMPMRGAGHVRIVME
jgi:hypothetical protein